MKHQLIAAAVVAAFCCAAQAAPAPTPAPISLSDTNAGPAAAFSYTGNNLGSSFSDILSFTLTGSPLWNVSGGAQASFFGLKLGNLVVGQGLKTLDVTIFGTTYHDALGSFTLGRDTLSAAIPLQFVKGGTFEAIISGTTVDTRLIPGHPSYSFNLVANPVPEPETYAMMMAGLGMMGFIARRRRNKVS